ncbi:hypothetical protein J6590_010937 [Homalodisca vitripennis]|nr:hypothetical protein J6590_010937 [Homalodisca vitripennis]
MQSNVFELPRDRSMKDVREGTRRRSMSNLWRGLCLRLDRAHEFHRTLVIISDSRVKQCNTTSYSKSASSPRAFREISSLCSGSPHPRNNQRLSCKTMQHNIHTPRVLRALQRSGREVACVQGHRTLVIIRHSRVKQCNTTSYSTSASSSTAFREISSLCSGSPHPRNNQRLSCKTMQHNIHTPRVLRALQRSGREVACVQGHRTLVIISDSRVKQCNTTSYSTSASSSTAFRERSSLCSGSPHPRNNQRLSCKTMQHNVILHECFELYSVQGEK